MSQSIHDHLKSNGYDFEPVFDGSIHRFKMPGRKDKSGWFVGHTINVSDKKQCLVMVYGDFAQNETIEWKSSGRFTESEKIKRDHQIKKLKEKAEEERKARQKEAAEKAKQDWERAQYINGVLPKYFKTKKLTKNFGLKTLDSELLIPAYDNFDGNITSYQKITDDGGKFFIKDGAIKSNFHYIKGSDETILVCEGFATGASLYEATGLTTVIAFYASNLYPVCEKLLKTFPRERLLVCADNDHLGDKNVGIKSAEDISKGLGIRYVFPEFDSGSKGTDFNDLMVEKGKSFVHSIVVGSSPKLSPMSGVRFDKKGQPINNINNVARVLENVYEGKIWYDEFFKRIFTTINGKKSEWSDSDDLILTSKFQEEFKFPTINESTVRLGCSLYAFKNVKNEPSEWLESLKWDGKNRICSFFHKSMKASDDDYTNSASKNFWISLVARILNPGCKVDNMVILEGDQGKKKSTALRLIAGDDCFAELAQDPSSKDFYMALQGKSLIEISELEAFSKADTLAIKRVISCQVDRYRGAYDKHTKDYPRTCIFVGTTNEGEYLKDVTGNRRFWPIEIKDVDLEYIAQNREQLFAEAVHCYKAGQKWWEMPEGTKEIAQSKVQVDVWESEVRDYCLGKEIVQIKDIATSCLKIEIGKIDRRVTLRIAGILRGLGYRNIAIRESGCVRKLWKKLE